MIQPFNEITNTWRVITSNQTSVIEMRAISPSGIQPQMPSVIKHFRASAFTNMEELRSAFEHEALRLNALGYNIYVVMNPIRSDFEGVAARDSDISHREIMLIDIDRAHDTKNPATDEEVEQARRVGDAIVEFLSGCDLIEPIRVMSGNGHHLYYPLKNVANSEEAKDVIKTTLTCLNEIFGNAAIKIDTNVFNASRITKVLGTVARKGTASVDRPYRMAVME
jgi:hypothetical protein